MLSITIIANASLAVSGINANGASATQTDLLNNPSSFNNQNNPFNTQELCTGTSTLKWIKVITTDAYYLPCSQFKDYTTCNSFVNCNYSYSSFIFINTSGCEGIVASDKIGNEKYKVNLSIYGFPLSDDPIISPDSFDFYTKYFGQGWCDSNNATRLGNRPTCEQFGCTWINASQQIGSVQNYQKTLSPISVWQTASWVLTFQFDFGFDPFVNIIVNFILAVLLPLTLFIVIYFMFVPF